MAIIKFEPDPTTPGAGNATDETGKTTYVHDPETLKRLNPTLADQVAAESTAVATAAVGAPQAMPDRRTASNDAAPGSPATATDAGGAPAAAVAKLDQMTPAAHASNAPRAAIAKLDQLPIAQSSYSKQTVKGRDAKVVEGEIGALRDANTTADAATRDAAAKADERNTLEQQGEQTLALGAHTRNYQAAQEERLRKEAVDAEVKRLNGEQDGVIDPDRLIGGMSTGSKVLMVIMAGLSGAFGNMQGKGQNTFLDAMNKRISEDIASQKDQIASGRLRRNNQIAALQAQGADARQAELAYTMRVYDAAERWGRAKIKEQGMQGAQLEQAELQLAQLAPQRAAIEAQLRQATEEKVVTNTNVVREAPKAAVVTADDTLKQVKAERDLAQLKASGLTQEEYDKQQKEYSDKASKNDDLVARAGEVAKALGGDVETVRDKEGNVTGYKVTGDLDAPLLGDAATKYESAIANLQRADVMGMAREPSNVLQEKFAEATDMPFRDSQKKVRLQQILAMALQERGNLQAGYNKHVVKATDTQKSPVVIETPTLREK